MLETRLMIYVRGGVIQQIETPGYPSQLVILIEDADDGVTYLAGVATCDEEDWQKYLKASKEEKDD